MLQERVRLLILLRRMVVLPPFGRQAASLRLDHEVLPQLAQPLPMAHLVFLPHLAVLHVLQVVLRPEERFHKELLQALQWQTEPRPVMVRPVRRHSGLPVSVTMLAVLLITLLRRLWPQLPLLLLRPRLTPRLVPLVGMPQKE